MLTLKNYALGQWVQGTGKTATDLFHAVTGDKIGRSEQRRSRLQGDGPLRAHRRWPEAMRASPSISARRCSRRSPST
jgi:hypothetical protein